MLRFLTVLRLARNANLYFEIACKPLKFAFYVIPAKAGIDSFQSVIGKKE
jgi:hypothetical protein